MDSELAMGAKVSLKSMPGTWGNPCIRSQAFALMGLFSALCCIRYVHQLPTMFAFSGGVTSFQFSFNHMHLSSSNMAGTHTSF